MLLNKNDSQLVLIDFQDKRISSVHEGAWVLNNARILANVAKKMRIPVFGTEQAPEQWGRFDSSLLTFCKATLVKSHFNGCAQGLIDLLIPKQTGGNTRSLPKHLQKNENEMERPSIVIAGMEAHIALLQTALDLLMNEQEVWVVTDACASKTERNRDAAFDRLASNGAELVTTEMVIHEWLESTENENFEFVASLIK